MNRLIIVLLLAAFAPFLHAEETKYRAVLTEPVPVTAIPLGKSEKELTPAMREALAGLEVAKQFNHLHQRKEFWKYPLNPIYREKSLHDFWIKERTLTPEEAAFAYTCLGIAAEDQILTRERLLKRAENAEHSDIELGSFGDSGGFGYTLKLACRPLKVGYSREHKAQEEEMSRVTAAALEAAVRRHRALLAALEPDFRKNYDLTNESEAQAARAKFPRPPNQGGGDAIYSAEAWAAYSRVRAIKPALFERARGMEQLYETDECQLFARVFLQWIPGDKDRIRQCLIDAGYTTPEARAKFWKIASAKPEYYFNEEHLARLYDPGKP